MPSEQKIWMCQKLKFWRNNQKTQNFNILKNVNYKNLQN